MGAAPITPRITVGEFLARPERTDGCFEELIEGVVYVSPNVKLEHNYVASRLMFKLQPLEEQGFVVLGEVACRLTDESLPNTDVCVISAERFDAAPLREFLRAVPELVVEVKSPSNTGQKLRKKAVLYLDHGAEQVWLVQPDSRNVVVATPEDDERIIGEDGTLEFRGLTVRVSDLLPGSRFRKRQARGDQP